MPAITTTTSSTGGITIPSEHTSFTTSITTNATKMTDQAIRTSEPEKPVLETGSDNSGSAGLVVTSVNNALVAEPVHTGNEGSAHTTLSTKGSHKHKKKKKHKHDVKGVSKLPPSLPPSVLPPSLPPCT